MEYLTLKCREKTFIVKDINFFHVIALLLDVFELHLYFTIESCACTLNKILINNRYTGV